jgi:uncharacterized membrane protein (DUF4010 family)
MGLGVGLERDWSKRGGEQQAAGPRTFALLALLGTLAASFGAAVVGAGLIAAAALVTAGYLRTSGDDRGTTTEFAAIVTYLLGALAWHDARVAVALAVVMVALLLLRGPVHHLAREVATKQEIEDAVRFFVTAFVVLPLLPDRSLGPYGVLNPQRIWLLVVALTGISWAGYIAVRAFGPQRGLLVTGFAGGFVSATATSGAMGHRARAVPADADAAVGGALLASVATFVQLALVTALASPELLVQLAPMLVAGGASTAVVVGAWTRVRPAARPEEGAPAVGVVDGARRRPFALRPALVLAAVLTLVLLAVRWGGEVAGSEGSTAVTALAGLADVHAAVLATASVFADGDVALRTAMVGCAAALLANTAAKCAFAFVAGGLRFGSRFSALLIVPSLVTAAAWWWSLP